MGATSVATVLRKSGNEIDLRIRNTLAGGINDYSITRSFAAGLLRDAGASVFDDLVFDQAWCVEHIDTFITRTVWLERVNIIDDADIATLEGIDRLLADVYRDSQAHTRQGEDRLCERMHHIVLRVDVRHAALLEGIEEGDLFESWSYDTSWDDPLRPTAPETIR